MDDPITLQTLLWFTPLVAGPDRIAANPGSFGQSFYRAVEEGYILTYVCPDWRAGGTRFNLPNLGGKLRLMPMPAFEPGGRRTSTWGGTMLGITRTADDPDLAWRYALHLYLDKETTAENFRETFILPPFKDLWDLPVFHEPVDYFGGQKIGELYISLADDVPPQYGSPYLQLAKAKMGEVVAACTAYYRVNGAAGFEDFARQRLDAAAQYVRFQMQRNPF
jgi:arabinosaccharide transport system substrate-binding protein